MTNEPKNRKPTQEPVEGPENVEDEKPGYSGDEAKNYS